MNFAFRSPARSLRPISRKGFSRTLLGVLALVSVAHVCVHCTTTGLPPLDADSGAADAAEDAALQVDARIYGQRDAEVDDASDAFADARSVDGSSDAGNFAVVVNEIAGDQEWIELFNTGTSEADMSGLQVADSAKDGTGPKLSEALKFPAGTKISAGGYILVAGKRPAGLGPTDVPPICQTPDAGDAGVDASADAGSVNNCFWAEWGISTKAGEVIYLLAADDKVLGQGAFPPNGAAAGETWGRLPNGTGPFAKGSSTPRAPNR
jgi:Lamin Tail Domain